MTVHDILRRSRRTANSTFIYIFNSFFFSGLLQQQKERPNKRELTYLPYIPRLTKSLGIASIMGFYFSWICIPSFSLEKMWAPREQKKNNQHRKNEERKNFNGRIHTLTDAAHKQIKLQNSEKRNKFIWLGFGCWLRSMHSFFLLLQLIDALLNYYFEWFYCGRAHFFSLSLSPFPALDRAVSHSVVLYFRPMDVYKKRNKFTHTHIISQQLFFFSSRVCVRARASALAFLCSIWTHEICFFFFKCTTRAPAFVSLSLYLLISISFDTRWFIFI